MLNRTNKAQVWFPFIRRVCQLIQSLLSSHVSPIFFVVATPPISNMQFKISATTCGFIDVLVQLVFSVQALPPRIDFISWRTAFFCCWCWLPGLVMTSMINLLRIPVEMGVCCELHWSSWKNCRKLKHNVLGQEWAIVDASRRFLLVGRMADNGSSTSSASQRKSSGQASDWLTRLTYPTDWLDSLTHPTDWFIRFTHPTDNWLNPRRRLTRLTHSTPPSSPTLTHSSISLLIRTVRTLHGTNYTN